MANETNPKNEPGKRFMNCNENMEIKGADATTAIKDLIFEAREIHKQNRIQRKKNVALKIERDRAIFQIEEANEKLDEWKKKFKTLEIENDKLKRGWRP